MGWLNKLFNLDSFKATMPDSPHSPVSYGDKSQSASGSSASKRLKLVLMHDRTQLSPAMMEQMRDELVEVISRYVEIDKDALDINLESESNTIALVANIPVLRARAGVEEFLKPKPSLPIEDVLKAEAANKKSSASGSTADDSSASAKPRETKENKFKDDLDRVLEKAVEDAEKSSVLNPPATGTAGT